MKNRAALLTCALFLAHADASELHPFVRGFFPADVSVSRDIGGVSSKTDYDTDFTAEAGAEFLAETEFSPFYFGGGIGLMGSQKDGELEVVPTPMPIWGSLSLRFPKSFREAFPFATLRVGWLMPITSSDAWWEAPLNFLVDVGAGVHLSQNVGFEVSYTFTSLEKSFEDNDLSYRFSSGRFGVSCYLNFEVTHKRNYVPNSGTTPEDEE